MKQYPFLKDLAFAMEQCANDDKSKVLNLMLKPLNESFYSTDGGALAFDMMLEELQSVLNGRADGESK